MINYACAQELLMSKIKINGVMIIEYQYIDDYNAYWYKNKFLLIESFDSLQVGIGKRILATCGDRNSILKNAEKSNLAGLIPIDSPHFRNVDKVIPGHHIGGDVYYFNQDSDKKKLIIAFRIRGNGVLMKSLCPCYFNQLALEEIPCEYSDKISTPFIVVGEIKEIFKLKDRDYTTGHFRYKKLK